MEEPEVPLEQVHEDIGHHAHLSQEKWVSLVALSTAIIAALAAVTGLLAGDHANEAMIHQIQASDQWAFYQAKGIKAAVLESRIEMLKSLGKPVPAENASKLSEYETDQKKIKVDAEEKKELAEHHLRQHVIFARGVTLFQVAIAVSAISILTKRKLFWGMSVVFGVIGLVSMLHGIFA